MLNDKEKSAVISQTGFILALGYSGGGNRIDSLKKLLSNSAHGSKLIEQFDKPLIFNAYIDDKDSKTPTIGHGHGYNVELLIDVCREIIYLDKLGKLHPSQNFLSANANIIVGASAKQGIKQLVYALSDYDVTKEETIASFKAFVSEEITRQYEPEFPNELYDEWYRIYKIKKPPRNHNWKMMHLTMNHIYYNIAKSRGKIQELLIIQKDKNTENRKKRLHEFLKEGNGLKALRQTIGLVMAATKLANNEKEYESNMGKLFGKKESDF